MFIIMFVLTYVCLAIFLSAYCNVFLQRLKKWEKCRLNYILDK